MRLQCLPMIAAALAAIAIGAPSISPSRAQELLPPATTQSQPPSVQRRSPCTPITYTSQSTLTVDFHPRNPTNDNYVNPADLPTNCHQELLGGDAAVFFTMGQFAGDLGCASLLQMARFCHPPVLFEDRALERCGVMTCCPLPHVTTHFACDLALLPAQVLLKRIPRCVYSPTPTCCQP